MRRFFSNFFSGGEILVILPKKSHKTISAEVMSLLEESNDTLDSESESNSDSDSKSDSKTDSKSDSNSDSN